MEKILLEISTMIKEQVHIVEINRDLPNEYSKVRLDLRTDAINKVEKIIHDLKMTLKSAEKIYENINNIERINNDRIISWKQPTFNPPQMICENIGGISILARRINYLEEAGPDLCFMPSINRFVVRFVGEILIGNVGNIYDICSDPERVRECRYANENYLNKISKCSKTDGECRFYHNPLIFPSSKEPRNFFATSGQYVPPNGENSNNMNYLRYGSRQNLEQDLKRITPEEIRRFDDYVAHIVLCWLILKKNKKI